MPTFEGSLLQAPFSCEDMALIDPLKIPKHVAIIMDGNRRWAKEKGILPIMGHWEGAEVLSRVVRAASVLGVETLTVYSFSTENWHRSKDELNSLMQLFEQYLVLQRDPMIRDGIRLDMIGNLDPFPESIKNAFLQTKKATEHCCKISLVLALNYGARDEIRRAVERLLKMQLKPEELTEQLIAEHLDTHQWGDPDLLIRTSGEFRVSNFLLWQISYAEIFVSAHHWPDFTPKDFLEAVLTYQQRDRRLGR